MGEIVWTQSRDTYGDDVDVDALGEHKIVLRSRSTIFKGPDKIAATSSSLYTGLNKSSGKRYFRWQTDNSIGFRVNGKGTIIPYYVRFIPGQYGLRGKWSNGGPGAAFEIIRPNRTLFNSEQNKLFRDLIADQFGVSELKDVFPVAGMYDIDSYDSMPWALRHAMRNDNFRDFITESFGKTQVRKDLVKAAALVRPDYVAYMREFRGLVPIDWIVAAMRRQAEYDANDQNRHNTEYPLRLDVRNLLGQMDARSYRHLLSVPLTIHHKHNINELCRAHQTRRQLEPLEGEVFRNWSDVHDKALPVRQYRYSKFEDGPVELVDVAEKMHNHKYGKYTVRCVTNTEQMPTWGVNMRNCIGSYRGQAQSGSGIFGAIYEGDKMIANFELRKHVTYTNKKATTKWVVGQLLGKANQSLTAERRKPAEEMFKSFGVVVPDNYWGAQ